MVLFDSSPVVRYYEAPKRSQASAVLLHYSDNAGVLVSYEEDHGVVVATATPVYLTDGSWNDLSSARKKCTP